VTPQKSDFRAWIKEQGGPSYVAALVGVSTSTVNKWYYRYQTPNVPSMTKMIELSNGRLCYNSILNSLLPLIKN